MTSLHALLQHAAPFLHDYGLWALFIGLFLETFGVPAPGETLLIAASLLASKGDFTLFQVILVGWTAAVLGDNAAFYVGHFGGRRLLLRLGGRLGLTHERLDKVERFYARFGAEVVIVARFFEGARQLNGLVAGSSGMAPLKFFIYNVIGAGLWVGFWATAAFYLGDHLGAIMSAFGRDFLIAAAIAVAAGLIYLGWRRWHRRKME
ncbi:DedA family protein [Acidihalobacter ferrooxydans]|uniref:VTT domain-containing protein n=1 Tax=Acidihalobacter ferrooxydans TaxID=1765967 RepID=A0A1P8UF10_9GAMM|nr:DedA family protein [Acidihalobacter ferrooxydans]APZ42399.1 hypothetical protein BW247_04270 [Acidihalobacter ferrooxydans]